MKPVLLSGLTEGCYLGCTLSDQIIFSFKGKQLGPGWCGSVDWAPTCELQRHWFDSQSGRMPGFRARSPVGGTREATTHWCFSSLPSPLSKNLFGKKGSSWLKSICCESTQSPGDLAHIVHRRPSFLSLLCTSGFCQTSEWTLSLEPSTE